MNDENDVTIFTGTAIEASKGKNFIIVVPRTAQYATKLQDRNIVEVKIRNTGVFKPKRGANNVQRKTETEEEQKPDNQESKDNGPGETQQPGY